MISTVTTTTTQVTTTEVMTLSIIAVVSLIVFLALKEILSSEAEHKSVGILFERCKRGYNTFITSICCHSCL